MIYVLIVPYLASGPFAPRLQADIYAHCPSTWVSQLFFINAVYPWYTNDGGCMGYAWYLGLDMMFAIIGMMLLNAWKRRNIVGWILAGGLTLVCIVITLQQAAYWNMTYDIYNFDASKIYGRYMYTRPWHRFPGFGIGLMGPWIL